MKKVFNIFGKLQKPYAKAFWLSIIISIISPIIGDIIAPIYFANFTNKMSLQTPYAIILGIVITYLLYLMVRTIIWAIGNWLLVVVEQKTMHTIADHTAHHLLDLSIDYFKNHSIGALVGKHNKFTRCYERIYDELFFNLIPSVTLFVSIITVLFIKMPLFGLGMMIVGLLFGYITYRFSRWQHPFNEKVSNTDSKVTALISDQLSNISTIHAFGKIQEEKILFTQMNTKRSEYRRTAWEKGYIQWRVNDLFYLIMVVSSVLTTAYLWDQKLFTLGDVILVVGYTTVIASKLSNIGNVIKNITQLITDGEEMISILQTQPTVQDNGSIECIENGDIVFNNMTFGYDINEPVFNKFNLHIKKGEKIGIVGESGSGKSTLVKLILREMDINSGSVMLNNFDIREYSIRSLRSTIATVQQEALLFHRSIKENISYARPNATDEEIIEAAKKAQAHDFIMKLSKGYDTKVGERGIKLSGGQRQRVAIARAFLAKRPIIIMDEATSSLDSISETKIQFAMKELLQSDDTMICIAHRLSTVANMDRIIVLKHGKIIEQGKHHELISSNGLYAEMWNKQLVFEEEEVDTSNNDEQEIEMCEADYTKQ
jgi:ATP-binding cassette, subfamily B, bacterial